MVYLSQNKYEVLLSIVFCFIFLSISNIFFSNLPPGAGLSLYVNNIVWLLCIVFVCIGTLYSVRKGQWIKPENFIVHLSLVLALVIPFIWSEDDAGRGFYRMLAAVFGILFFLSLFCSFPKNKIWILVLAISLSGFIQACWGITQLWFVPDLTIVTGMPFGVFQQPNVMSSYIVTTFIVSLMLLSLYSVPNEKISKWVCRSVNLFALLAGILIVTLNSASSYLALAISLPLMLLARCENHRRIFIAIICMLLGCFISVLFESNFTSSSVIGSDVVNFSLADSFDSGGRENIWLICWEMFRTNWLTGVGYGNFEHSFLVYQAEYYEQYGVYAYEKLNHPHNEFILWAVEGGILPGLAFGSYTIYVLWRMFKMGRSALPYAAMLLPLVTHALLEFPFYHSAIHWILFVTLLFLFEIQAGQVKAVKINYKVFINSMALVVSLAAGLFFATNMHAINSLNDFNKTDFEKRNATVFSNIINNFTVQTHLDYFAMSGLMNKGMIEKDKALIKKSISLSEKLQSNHPRPAYYKNMLIGYEVLGDKEKFKIKLDEARHFYPINDYFLGVEERFKLIL